MSVFEVQLSWMQAIQESLRGPLMDAFFFLVNEIDRPNFFFLLAPASFLFGGRRFGLKVIALCLVSGLFNALLKNFFQIPRPCETLLGLNLVPIKGYSFPSGAAQMAVWLSVVCRHRFKSKLSALFAPLFFLVLSFSRVYLGVHYPTDLVAGWFVGALIAFAFTYKGAFDALQEAVDRGGALIKGLYLALPSLAFFLHPSGGGLQYAFIFISSHLLVWFWQAYEAAFWNLFTSNRTPTGI